VAQVLRDLFIGVKTSERFHHSRLVVQLETWMQLAASQTFVFTDQHDAGVAARLPPGHLVVTNCSSSHSRAALACKTAAEFDAFVASYMRWWCHFDDDNYVHVARLAAELAAFDADRPFYLGKPSTAEPLRLLDGSASGAADVSGAHWKSYQFPCVSKVRSVID